MKMGWGKDYWSIFIKVNGKLLATDSGSEIWFSDIAKEDANTTIQMSFIKTNNRIDVRL
jgi:hypothetical protein